MAQLIEHDKKFLIIGNKTACKAKEIFPYIKDEIQKNLPEAKIIESGDATVMQLKKYFEKANLKVKNKDRKLVFLTTGDLESCFKQITRLNYQFDDIKKVKI